MLLAPRPRPTIPSLAEPILTSAAVTVVGPELIAIGSDAIRRRAVGSLLIDAVPVGIVASIVVIVVVLIIVVVVVAVLVLVVVAVVPRSWRPSMSHLEKRLSAGHERRQGERQGGGRENKGGEREGDGELHVDLIEV